MRRSGEIRVDACDSIAFTWNVVAVAIMVVGAPSQTRAIRPAIHISNTALKKKKKLSQVFETTVVIARVLRTWDGKLDMGITG